MLSVQHHNHKVVLTATPDGVRASLFVTNRLVGELVIVGHPFHVLADRAHAWVRQRDWPQPADLVHL